MIEVKEQSLFSSIVGWVEIYPYDWLDNKAIGEQLYAQMLGWT